MTLQSLKVKRGQARFGSNQLALFIFVLAFGAAAAATPARAASDRHGIGFSVGQVLLMGTYAETFNDGLGLGATYSYEASDMFGLLARFSTNSHTNSNGANSLNIKGLIPDLRVNLAYFDKLVLYGMGGFGLYHVDETINGATGSAWTFGLDIGAGFLLELNPHFAFGSSLDFHNVFSKTDQHSVTSSMPNGIDLGGTYMDILLNVFYYF